MTLSSHKTTEARLRIFGRNISVQLQDSTESSIHDQKKHLEKIGDLLETKYQELREAKPNLKREETLILLAMNLMDEIVQQQENGLWDKQLAARTSQLISLIDDGIIADKLDS